MRTTLLSLCLFSLPTLGIAQSIEPPKSGEVTEKAKTGTVEKQKAGQSGKGDAKQGGDEESGKAGSGKTDKTQKSDKSDEAQSKSEKVQKTDKVEKTDKIEKIEAPAGADPEDLRAIRGANQMLEAEARLRKLLESGKIEGIDRILTFEELSSWPYQDGLKGMPSSVKKFDGKKVMMTGFMLPIDEVADIKEFLLVQSLWSCCYGTPPDINGIVRVVMKGDSRVDYEFEPIKIIGDFKIEAALEDGYCVDIYQLHSDNVEVIH